MFRNALVSVTDKSGLIDFLKPLVKGGLRVVSTGGTAEHLRGAGIPVVEVREQTGFPEVMDGRVRTLHPRIHMALLARNWVESDLQLLREQNLEPFDLVIGNLYKFEKYRGQGLSNQDIVEHIDIGGPALLRASAKNFDRITVVVDPKDYEWIAKKPELELGDRKKLAAKVFQHVSHYDNLIAQELAEDPKSATIHIEGSRVQELRYGENPHQKAGWYSFSGNSHGLHSASILQGKELSFNNILDLDAASRAAREFCLPTCVIVKHNNPCGVASDNTMAEAVKRAIASDSISAFGGIVALNRELDAESVEILHPLFLECIIAPQVGEEARVALKSKKNLRVLEWPGLLKRPDHFDFRSVSGGFVQQEQDSFVDWKEHWKCFGPELTSADRMDLIFAFRVVGHLKSNAIVLSHRGQTVGLGMGQVNRVDAVRHAVERMQQHFSGLSGAVLASDAFFPFPDSVEIAAKAKVRWIIQPGGSKKDDEVLARAQSLGIGMVLTNERHFRH